jgi:hypothetical protein
MLYRRYWKNIWFPRIKSEKGSKMLSLIAWVKNARGWPNDGKWERN